MKKLIVFFVLVCGFVFVVMFGDDGLYDVLWIEEIFLDLCEDLEIVNDEGKCLLLMIE